jgi:Mor family transcriptional regulator
MARESAEALDRMFGRLAREFGAADAERIAKVLAEEIGGFRLVFPDVADMARMVRNQHICDSFKGDNYEELALRHSLHPINVRRIVARGARAARQQ